MVGVYGDGDQLTVWRRREGLALHSTTRWAAYMHTWNRDELESRSGSVQRRIAKSGLVQ
jgi:hypothetical protein